VRALGRARLRRHQLDGAHDLSERGVAATAGVQVDAEALVQERGAQRVVRTDQLDRAPRELDRPRGRTRQEGEAARVGCNSSATALTCQDTTP